MAFTLHNLAADSLTWFFAPDPARAFRSWVDQQEPDVRVGIAALGVWAPQTKVGTALGPVVRHRERIREFVLADAWNAAVDDGVRASALALNQIGPDVRLYVLVGPGRSNASATGWRDRGLAFVWLENWLGHGATGGELQDLELQLLPSAVSHELAHALRYALTGTMSLLRRMNVVSPEAIWDARMSLPLREVMYDEGLATRFSRDAFPDLSVADSLLMNAEQVAWLDERWTQLLADRTRRWNLDQPNPPMDWFIDALAYVPARSLPPWTVERPPAKWAYYVGLKWAEQSQGDWSRRLRSSPPAQLAHDQNESPP
jgi:hypothetical protein